MSMPMASKFNETVPLDLKFINGKIICVMVVMFTRYCVAKLIPNKTANSIVQTFLNSWIVYFGALLQILSDNGGEFNNDIMRSLADFYNVRLLTTAAESPWSNALCGSLNGLLSISTQSHGKRWLLYGNCSVLVCNGPEYASQLRWLRSCSVFIWI